MANALKTLFADIATAIKRKNGDPDTVKYKPMEFPNKIMGIVSGTAKTWVVDADQIESTNTAMVIEHKLGVVPDMVLVCISDPPSSEGGSLVYAFGLSSAAISATGGQITNSVAGIKAALTLNVGIDGNTNASEMYGMIRDATATEFTVGGERCTMEVGKNYDWYAISGII